MTAARRRPSSVDALRRGVGAGTPAANNPATLPDFQSVRNPSEPPRRPRREKPVRFTLDLERAHHQFLKEYAVQAEARGAAEVMRALLDELRDDPELAARVRARIWQH